MGNRHPFERTGRAGRQTRVTGLGLGQRGLGVEGQKAAGVIGLGAGHEMPRHFKRRKMPRLQTGGQLGHAQIMQLGHGRPYSITLGTKNKPRSTAGAFC